nr:hypothetical protein GCM10017745_16220 [Saccharothrix mutabilis subsp. capreolus]
MLDLTKERVARAPIPDDDKKFLTNLCDDLEREVQALNYALPAGPVHGDAHVQNLLVSDAGHVIIIDLERFAWGQPEWDLAMTATEYATAGWWTPQQYSTYVKNYGFDVTDWSGFPVARAVHELKMTTWIMQNVHTSAKIANEYGLRMGTLRHRDNIGMWTAF